MTPTLRVSTLALAVAATLLCAPSARAQLLTTPDVTVDGTVDVNLGDDATVEVDVLTDTSDPTTVDADVNIDLGDDGDTGVDADADVHIGGDGDATVDVDADLNIGGEADATADIRIALGDASSVDASLVLDLFGQDYTQVLRDGRIGGRITVFDVSELADAGAVSEAVANNSAQVDALRRLLADDPTVKNALTRAGVSRNTVVAARATNNGLQLFTMRSGGGGLNATGSNCSAARAPDAPDLRAVANAEDAKVLKLGCSVATARWMDELRAVIDANSAIEADITSAGYSVDDVVGAEMASDATVTLYVD